MLGAMQIGSSELASLQHYVGFDDNTVELIRAFHPVAEPHFNAIIDDFYATIEAHPHARQVVTGGKAQIERLKLTLVAWLESVLSGVYDADYLERHARIGRVHVRIGLPQELMFTAMNRIRSRLIEVVHADVSDADRRVRVAQAVNRVLDLELALMLDTYRADLTEKIRTAERLATIGQLAASIGHELRNPLGTIESSLFLMRQRMKKSGISDEQLDKHLAKIDGQVGNCAETISNLLDLARNKPPSREHKELVPFLEKLVGDFVATGKVEVELEVPDGTVIDVDPLDLTHVLTNLLSNAMQAAPLGAHVWISAERVRGGTQLRVRDDGPGVSPEIRHRIFDALFTTNARGTGLGLALCRRIVDAHGGELALESSERGANFRLWFPDAETEKS
jgi:signal transduction histidine kinase